jgi:hypothetical protein
MELKKPQTFSSPAHTKAMDISQLLVSMASDGYETNWDGFVRIRRRIHFLCQQVLLEGVYHRLPRADLQFASLRTRCQRKQLPCTQDGDPATAIAFAPIRLKIEP